MKIPEKLLYQTNKTSYSLMLFYILFLVVYLVVVLRSMTVNYQVAYVSLVNVVIMLNAFLVAVKINVYNARFQYVPVLFAIIQGLQLLYIPDGLTNSSRLIAIFAGIIAIVCAMGASAISIYKNNIRKKLIIEKNIKDSHLAK